MTDFEISAVLAGKGLLGLYVADPKGELNAAVFAMPELKQKCDSILSLQLEDGTQVEVGNSLGKEDHGVDLNIVSICEKPYDSVCFATLVSNGQDLTVFNLTLTDAQKSFRWRKK